ncbi:cupin-like domain-containing protein [Streptomyces atratus]
MQSLNVGGSARQALYAPAAAYAGVVLRAGDVLYLPRAWWHLVVNSD